MRRLVFGMFFCMVVLLMSACTNGDQYKPEHELDENEQSEFKYAIVRLAGHLPKRAKQDTKFESRFDSVYRAQADLMQLDKYFVNKKDGYTYFEISRMAPSFKKKYVATGGRLKQNAAGDIEEYEEIYRTWKMERPQLAEKTALFFAEMVDGKDLSRYYTDNIGDTEHIEFPDKNTFYNKTARKWEARAAILSDSNE